MSSLKQAIEAKQEARRLVRSLGATVLKVGVREVSRGDFGVISPV